MCPRLTLYSIALFCHRRTVVGAIASMLVLLLAVVPSTTSAQVATVDVRNLSAALQLHEPALLLQGGDSLEPPGNSLRQRWTWQHIAGALSSHTLGGPLTVQRDRDGLFPFVSGGALSSLLPPDSPFNRANRAALSIDGAELPALLRGQGASNANSSSDSHSPPWRYYFSGKIMELASGKPVARHMQTLGYELLEDTGLVKPLIQASTMLRSKEPGQVEGATSKKVRAAELQGNIWLSSGNASTPLHYDTSMNVFIQLRGRKRFWLLPPDAATSLPMEPVHSPGHRQLATRALSHGSREHGGVGQTQCLPYNEGLSGTSAETISEQALAAVLSPSVIEQLQMVELGPGDALYLPPYWLHHTVAISPRGCLSVSLWAESLAHEHLMKLLAADMPPQDAIDPQGRLAWASLLLTNVLRALSGDRKGPSGPESSCKDEEAITGSRVAKVLRSRYAGYASLSTAAWECNHNGRAGQQRDDQNGEMGRFVELAAGWLSHPEAKCAVQLLNFVQYAERLLPWVLGLRGDLAEHATESVRSQLPASALCLADMLKSVEAASR